MSDIPKGNEDQHVGERRRIRVGFTLGFRRGELKLMLLPLMKTLIYATDDEPEANDNADVNKHDKCQDS